MDLDFRASTLHSANHLSSVHAARLHFENYSVYNNTDEDDDAQSLFQCPSCDFELEMPVLRTRLEQVCPVCDEYLGEDAIKVAPHSSSRKRTWKPTKSSTWYGNYTTLEEKLAAWTKKQEPVPVPNPSDIHPDEDSFSDTSDISVEKSYETDALDTGDEEDHEERRQRASFVQELVLSTLF
ncbi:protein DEHYDRATION-INDUCED 19-like isoform X2 [Gastrolobium bilobum]|uniref:protein DEHYDRATION-INDUCED 19-like isoform X2 n=1 Tax=Gastrolobium bilobum TaxID=150636 RepID=UPI002AB19A9C|nr:protein DEHYDRATION-INDUCED 19-like isoform X2 [Gastrolobium bilobum]